MAQVQQAADELRHAATEATGSPLVTRGETRVHVEEPGLAVTDLLWRGTLSAIEITGQVILVLALSYYLLASGDLFKRKLVKMTGATPSAAGGAGLAGFLQFGTLTMACVAAGTAVLVATLEGLLITPLLMGRAGSMNAAAVFIGLSFLGWIWGVWGLLLAVPIMMAVKVICDHVEDLKPIGEMLAD
jgi:predicted PurR-regulated permease PerM